jgi:hypothetical protein
MRTQAFLGSLGVKACTAAVFGLAPSAFAGPSSAIYTTVKDGTAVNQNIYGSTNDVYIGGGPQNANASGLPDGTYTFRSRIRVGKPCSLPTTPSAASCS